MKLSDKAIREQNLISPYHSAQQQPASYDIKLGQYVLVPEDLPPGLAALDLRLHDPRDYMKKLDISSGYILKPGEAVLGTTQESLSLPKNVVAQVDGKSSIGRLFVTTHVTAGYIDPYFHGKITLEIVNLNPKWPIVLYNGMEIGQFSFMFLDQEAEIAYGDARLQSHYQHQDDVQAAVGLRDPQAQPVQTENQPALPRAIDILHAYKTLRDELVYQDKLWDEALALMPKSSFVNGDFAVKHNPKERLAQAKDKADGYLRQR